MLGYETDIILMRKDSREVKLIEVNDYKVIILQYFKKKSSIR